MISCLWIPLAVGAQTAQVSQPEAVNVDELIVEALANGKGSGLLSEYTYTVRLREQQTDKRGQVKETGETYEAYLPTLKNLGLTRSVLIQVTEKGVLLSAEKLERERQKAAERLVKAEAESQKFNRRTTPRREPELPRAKGAYFEMKLDSVFGSDVKLEVKTLLRTCEFTAPRRVLIEEREAIALDFRPLPGVQFEKAERYLALTTGMVWIDAQDRVLVRAEGWPRESAPRTGKPVFLYEQLRLPDGYWLPRRAQLNGETHRAIFEKTSGKLNVDYTFEFADYKRFAAEAQDVKLKRP